MMKTQFTTVVLCAVLMLCTSTPTTAKLFLVDVDYQGIVVDFYVEAEQLWQEGLPPAYAARDYGFKIWYPHLADAFDMDLSEQLEWIEYLDYAGIRDWRIGYYWDTVPLKASLFGGLSGVGPNRVMGINSSVYFAYTCAVTGPGGQPAMLTFGRTGNELGDPDLGGNGAMIEAGGDFGFPEEDYPVDGTLVPGREDMKVYYTLIRSHAQDHWASLPSVGMNVYDDDLNCTPDYLPYGIWPGTGPVDCGVWTVAESIPRFMLDDKGFHVIAISDVIHPAGTRVPVTVFGFHHEDYPDEDSYPQCVIKETNSATTVRLRVRNAQDTKQGVYHIDFTDGSGVFTFKVEFKMPHKE
jgi:hypothetical protein